MALNPKVVKASRFPPVLSTVKARHQHRVAELYVNFIYRLDKPFLHAVWVCGNRGGSHKSRLAHRPDLPMCEKCETS